MWSQIEVSTLVFPAFGLPPFPLLAELETSVSTQMAVLRRREASTLVCSRPCPGITGASQFGAAGLFIRPDLAVALRSRDLLLLKGAIVL